MQSNGLFIFFKSNSILKEKYFE